MSSLTAEARERSLELLQRASSPRGYLASPDFDHYSQIWTRDAAISSLGALVSGEETLSAVAIRTLESMAATATPRGQVAAVIHVDGDTWDWGESGVVDATAWYVILAGAVLATTGDDARAREHWPLVSSAMEWLGHQDVTGSGLISGAPATDWMDASLVRSGRTLHLNALYHWAATASAEVATTAGAEPPADPADIAWRINTLFWPNADIGPETLMTGLSRTPKSFPHSATVRAHAEAAARDRRHYVSHVIHSYYDEHCDVLANTILIATGVAGVSRASSILGYLDEKRADQPFPSRAFTDPVDIEAPSSMFIPGVERHLDTRWRNPPNSYHNAGVWPYLGGFHVSASALAGRAKEAAAMLDSLADANRRGAWGFHEWLHGETGEPGGTRSQTWNAGAYLIAEAAVQNPSSVMRIFGRESPQ